MRHLNGMSREATWELGCWGPKEWSGKVYDEVHADAAAPEGKTAPLKTSARSGAGRFFEEFGTDVSSVEAGGLGPPKQPFARIWFPGLSLLADKLGSGVASSPAGECGRFHHLEGRNESASVSPGLPPCCAQPEGIRGQRCRFGSGARSSCLRQFKREGAPVNRPWGVADGGPDRSPSSRHLGLSMLDVSRWGIPAARE